MRLIFLVVCVVLVTAGCGEIRGHSPSHPTEPSDARSGSSLQGSQVTATVSDQASLPVGYDPVSELAGDPDGTGVWFWDVDASAVDLFHVDGQGALTSWPVLTGASYANERARSGLAVSTSGTVWLGINATLVSLNPLSGAVKAWTIPPPNDNPDAESYLPSKLAGTHAVQALATAPNGEVAIAMSNSSSITEFNPSTTQFSVSNLPASSDEPLSLAFAEDGTLGVGIADLSTGGHADSLVLVTPSGSMQAVTVPQAGSAWEIAPFSASEFVVGSLQPYLVGTDGTVSQMQSPSSLTGSGSAPTPIAVLPNDLVAGIGASGVVEFPNDATSQSSADASSVTLSLPPLPCVPGSPGSPPGLPPAALSQTSTTIPVSSTTTVPPVCHPPALDIMTVDGAGNIWIVSPLGTSPGVAELVP